MANIKLQYFKKSGKFYSDGEYETQLTHPHEVSDEIRQMQVDGKLPGLVDGSGKEFYIYTALETLDLGFPMLFQPLEK